MSKFKAGDIITNGQMTMTVPVSGVYKGSYRFDSAESLTVFYMPMALVDRLWTLAPETPEDGVYQGEIEG